MGEKRAECKVAVHLFLMRDEKLLLLRRYNTGYEDGSYSVVAGHLDGDEEVTAAAIREAKEEAGIMIERGDIEMAGVMHRRSNDERIDFFVAVRRWAGEISNKEPHKCDELTWYHQDELPERVIPYVRKAFQNYRNGVWFDSYGW